MKYDNSRRRDNERVRIVVTLAQVEAEPSDYTPQRSSRAPCARDSRLLENVRRDRSVDDPEHPRQCRRISGEQEPQRERHCAQETVLEAAAFQISLELLLQPPLSDAGLRGNTPFRSPT